MTTKQVTIITGEPTVSVIADMALDWAGIGAMAEWVRSHRPECLPDEYDAKTDAAEQDRAMMLFPHEGYEPSGDYLRKHEDDPAQGAVRQVTDNELLAELAGRKCYDSFGLKAGKKSNREYLANTQMHVNAQERAKRVFDGITDDDGHIRHERNVTDEIVQAIRDAQDSVPHASILYHAKMTFFIGGVSRRVSHELIRNYVGADRDEEGSPSQESTRYTEHYGHYVAHPYILGDSEHAQAELATFRSEMQHNYDGYLHYVERQSSFLKEHGRLQALPTTIQRKRILESASPYLAHSCETSWVWTTNPMALAKMIKERDTEAADLEFRRLARVLKRVAVARWPNLFPQPWMQR